MITEETRQNILRIVMADAKTKGLHTVVATAAEATEYECKVGDTVGCAVYSLAKAAGLLPGSLSEVAFWEADVYAQVAHAYGLSADKVNDLWLTNDQYDDRAERLQALREIILAWPVKENEKEEV